MSYSADNIKVLNDIEHIQLRSGMYIGEATDPRALFSEMFDNAMDEVSAGHSTELIVEVDTKENRYTVHDFGRGIPHGKKKLENGEEKERSLRLCREHQLAVISRVFNHFISGQGALSEKQLFSGLHLPETMLKQEIAELLNKKIICRTMNDQQELAFLPGVPPENFTVLDFLNAVGGKGDAETPEFSRFDRAFKAMENAVTQADINIRIIDIDKK